MHATNKDYSGLQEDSRDNDQAGELAPLPSATVYEVIATDGAEEMERPVSALWWSGLAAGFAISISLFVMASLRQATEGVAGSLAIEKFGYCVGFLVVVLGRLQLFTENTITPVLPVMRDKSFYGLLGLARLWTVVLAANLAGTFLAAALPFVLPVTSPEYHQHVMQISMHFAERPVLQCFASAIPAGFLVAAMVWMLPSSKGFEFWTIVAVTYAIAICDTSHVIVGSTELFTAVMAGQLDLPGMLSRLAATGLGNIVGGTGLFAVMAYAQVREEVE